MKESGNNLTAGADAAHGRRVLIQPCGRQFVQLPECLSTQLMVTWLMMVVNHLSQNFLGVGSVIYFLLIILS